MYPLVTIVGNTGRAPELRYLPDGTAVCDFTVAVNKRWVTASGAPEEKVTWFKVVCWRRLAETVNQYVAKGRQVLVVGEVEAEAWADKDGNAHATLTLPARDVKCLGKRDAEDAPGDGDNGPLPF
jgi:single-strand DNA-binding protein